MKIRNLILSMMMVFFATTAFAALETNSMAPDFTLTDSKGKTHALSDFKDQYVVLEWVNYDCPFVKKHYKPNNMQNLQKEFTDKDVVWLSINSSAPGKQGNYNPEQINEIIENAKAVPTAYLLDSDGTVGKLYGAKTTPHMFVINPEGKVVYQGAIDSIPSFSSSDISSADNFVAMALNQGMSGAPVKISNTKPYGCSVKY